MSYAIHPFSVSIESIKKEIPAKHRRLYRSIEVLYKAELEEDEADLEANELSLRKAVYEIVYGLKLHRKHAAKYGYAVELLCDRFGKLLTNEHWSAMRWDWIEEVDKALGKVGIPETLFRVEKHLLTRGSPIPIPTPEDFPAIGFLKADEMGKIMMRLNGVVAAIEDEEVRGSVGEVLKWLDQCARSHEDLVCFYH